MLPPKPTVGAMSPDPLTVSASPDCVNPPETAAGRSPAGARSVPLHALPDRPPGRLMSSNFAVAVVKDWIPLVLPRCLVSC